jgi:N-acetylmuramic acid 6-phosphate etherase
MNSETPAVLPITEQENPRSTKLSSLSPYEIVNLINEEDSNVPSAVRKVLPDIARAVEAIIARLSGRGRLFYIGTGTSGRLGVLDAAECPPTFGVSPDLVQGVIAGGYEACYRAVEASEDDPDAAVIDLQERGLTKEDVLVGIAASGRTPYTVGGVSYARSIGAMTIALTCVPESAITRAAELKIVPVVGPEVVTGSTRMKAGTAQKMVLNMLSTATLVKLGYVTGNRMTSVQTRNTKLRERAIRILIAEAGLNEAKATAALEAAQGDIRVALVMSRTGCARESAVTELDRSKGVVSQAIAHLKPI